MPWYTAQQMNQKKKKKKSHKTVNFKILEPFWEFVKEFRWDYCKWHRRKRMKSPIHFTHFSKLLPNDVENVKEKKSKLAFLTSQPSLALKKAACVWLDVFCNDLSGHSAVRVLPRASHRRWVTEVQMPILQNCPLLLCQNTPQSNLPTL